MWLSLLVCGQVRSFEDCAAGVWDGTGFVVSLENPKEALILTNRHIITPLEGILRQLAL